MRCLYTDTLFPVTDDLFWWTVGLLQTCLKRLQVPIRYPGTSVWRTYCESTILKRTNSILTQWENRNITLFNIVDEISRRYLNLLNNLQSTNHVMRGVVFEIYTIVNEGKLKCSIRSVKVSITKFSVQMYKYPCNTMETPFYKTNCCVKIHKVQCCVKSHLTLSKIILKLVRMKSLVFMFSKDCP